MGKKRTDKIVAVTVTKSATMYVEADTPEEAIKYAKEHGHWVDSFDFMEVESAESHPTEAKFDMKEIWVDGGVALSVNEYLDELEEQEEIDKRQLNLFDNMEDEE